MLNCVGHFCQLLFAQIDSDKSFKFLFFIDDLRLSTVTTLLKTANNED